MDGVYKHVSRKNCTIAMGIVFALAAMSEGCKSPRSDSHSLEPPSGGSSGTIGPQGVPGPAGIAAKNPIVGTYSLYHVSNTNNFQLKDGGATNFETPCIPGNTIECSSQFLVFGADGTFSNANASSTVIPSVTCQSDGTFITLAQDISCSGGQYAIYSGTCYDSTAQLPLAPSPNIVGSFQDNFICV